LTIKKQCFFNTEITHPDSRRVNEGLAVIYLLNNDAENAIYYLDKINILKQSHKQPEYYLKYLIAYYMRNSNLPEYIYRNR